MDVGDTWNSSPVNQTVPKHVFRMHKLVDYRRYLCCSLNEKGRCKFAPMPVSATAALTMPAHVNKMEACQAANTFRGYERRHWTWAYAWRGCGTGVWVMRLIFPSCSHSHLRKRQRRELSRTWDICGKRLMATGSDRAKVVRHTAQWMGSISLRRLRRNCSLRRAREG